MDTKTVPQLRGKPDSSPDATDAVRGVLRRARAGLTVDAIQAVLALEREVEIDRGIAAGILARKIDATLPPSFEGVPGVDDFKFRAAGGVV